MEDSTTEIDVLKVQLKELEKEKLLIVEMDEQHTMLLKIC